MRAGMGLRTTLAAVALGALTVASPSPFAARPDAPGNLDGDSPPPIVRAWRNGLYLMLSTATAEGRCADRGGEIVCAGGEAVALADREGGCSLVEYGGSCVILGAPGLTDTLGATTDPDEDDSARARAGSGPAGGLRQDGPPRMDAAIGEDSDTGGARASRSGAREGPGAGGWLLGAAPGPVPGARSANPDDGRRYAEGPLATGSVQDPAQGGARRFVGDEERRAWRRDARDEPGDGGSAPAESRIDIECETGPKRGTIYTISDGDGRGSCGANRDVDGRVNGGTCTKGGSECGNVDCEHGCGVAAGNCSCQVRSIGRRTMQTDPD